MLKKILELKTRFSKQTLLFLLLLVVGAALRFYNYDYFPIRGETEDEQAWTLLGASLIQEGTPISWSHFGTYENYHFQAEGTHFPLVKPSLDQPPLFALIPGAFHSLKYDWVLHASIKLIRFPMFLLGVLNLALFMLVARQLFQRPIAAWLASLIFATAPTVVFGSRMVVSENLLVTWLLATLLLLLAKNRPRYWFQGLVLASILSVLTKFSGIVLPLSLLVFGLAKKEKIVAQAGLLGLLGGAFLFALYGAFYNWQLFLRTLFAQSSRDVGLTTLFFRLFLNPNIVARTFFDGWVIVGLLAIPWLGQQKTKPFNFLTIFMLLSLLFIATAVGEQTIHGWYDYIWHPVVILAAGGWLEQILVKKQYWLLALIWLFLLPTVRMALAYTKGYPDVPIWAFRGLVGLGALPALFQALISKKKFAQQLINSALIALLLIIVSSQIVTIITMNHQVYWETDEFFKPSLVVK